MWVIVGLGNPGPKYARHRHNIGFMAADQIAERYGFSAWVSKFLGSCCEGRIGAERVFLLKPSTFMNLSGQSAAALCSFYKIPPSRVIAIHDELDLPQGKLRVKLGGGSGGHNGLKSMDEHLGPDYWRVRIGIGHPGHSDLVSGYVLSDFSKSELTEMQTLLHHIAEHIGLCLTGDDAGFMNKISVALQPPRAKKEPSPSAS